MKTRIMVLLTVALLCGGIVMGGEAPADEVVKFFADGRVISLVAGGGDVYRDGKPRSGFSALVFDGNQVRTKPMTRVTKSGDMWLVQGDVEFPRFHVKIEKAGSGLSMKLERVEGAPLGRDSSLMFYLNTKKQMQAEGKGVAVEAGKESLQIVWKYIGVRDAVKNYEVVKIGVKP